MEDAEDVRPLQGTVVGRTEVVLPSELRLSCPRKACISARKRRYLGRHKCESGVGACRARTLGVTLLVDEPLFAEAAVAADGIDAAVWR